MLLNDNLDFDSDGEHMNNDRYEKAVKKYSKLEEYCKERIKMYRIQIHKCHEALFDDTHPIENDGTYEVDRHVLKEGLIKLERSKLK